MNVNDRWMLEQMQQMAAAMAVSLTQTSQNVKAPKTEKGESFQDMMDKAVKNQKTEAPQKENAAESKEPVQGEKPVQDGESAQKVQKTQKTVQTDPKTGMRQIDVTPEEAALLVAGYAKLSPPMEDATVWMVTVRDENGTPVLPLAELEAAKGAVPFGADLFADTTGEWVLDEITPEFTQALEQLLAKTGDPRPVQDILSKLEQKIETLEDLPKLEIVVKTPAAERPEQFGEQEETDDNLDAKLTAASQPLFKDVKAAPVKVGENFQLDTQQPDMDAQLAETIRYAAQQGLKQIEIRLSPENLGELTVKLTQSVDGTLQVVLHAANPKAANLLTQHLDSLNMALQGYGQTREVQVQVQRGEDSQQAQQQYQQADPDGRNRQQQQQHRQEQHSDGQEFIQRLRLGLFNLEDVI